MLSKYDWIQSEKQYFGQANTAYDFEANDPKEASKRLNKLNETKEKLGKIVNMRAMNMLGKAEETVRRYVFYITHNRLKHTFYFTTTKICVILHHASMSCMLSKNLL